MTTKKITCHEIALIMNGSKVTKHTSFVGQTWWEARIGKNFGCNEDGTISAIGSTREQALERLVEECKKLGAGVMEISKEPLTPPTKNP